MKSLFLLFTVVLILPGCFSKKLSMTPNEEIRGTKTLVTSPLLKDLLGRYPEYFDSLLRHNELWQIKIIYTQVDRGANNTPVFKNFYFNIDPKQYFYPASTVKLPVAVLSLQRLNELRIAGLDRNTTMITEAAYPGQDAVYNDPNSPDGRPTIANYIKKIFLVSDNDAFNRLYEFLGQEYINITLEGIGYDSVQILHRLNISRTEEQNRHTNPVKFYDSSFNIVYAQPLARSRLVYARRKDTMGRGYLNGGKIINQPFDFSKKNRCSLADLHSMLQSIIFPEAIPERQRFRLSAEDYRFLRRYLSMRPRESDFPQYDSSYNGAFAKLLMYGGRGDLDPHIRIFNKEGDAYGFLTDVAYITDLKNGVEFFLSASICCNSDGIFNDDHYDYEQVGLPFLKNLGQVVYQYELQRKRKRIPDLSAFEPQDSK